MDTVTYPDPRVAEFIERHFLPARIKVKENPPLVESFLVGWTPDVVVADGHDRVHYRIEGYLGPDDFLAHLSIGLGKYRLNRGQFPEAAERFDEVARRHHGTDAGAEALYWLAVAHFKLKHDVARLHAEWQLLARDYPNSEWTRRTQIPRRD